MAKAGKQVVDAVCLAYHANRSVLLKGKHGVGKSEQLEQAADELGIQCIVRDLSMMEPTDLAGLPREKNGRTVYSPPSFLPNNGNGLLVFEELNRCEKYMTGPCLQLLTARRLNDYVLPSGWVPMAAINPDDGEYDVNRLDPALLSRFSVIEVTASVPEWLAWAEKAGVHPTVTRYVRETKDVFKTAESNPRAWKYVSDLVKAQAIHGGTDGALATLVTGQVGPVHGAAFLASCRGAEAPLLPRQVIESYARVRASVQAWAKQKRIDLLSATLHNVEIMLQNTDECATIARSSRKRDNLKAFAADLPGDLRKKLEARMKDGGLT